ncbi:MAG TPA: tetraacyldisaccharide 4'-kinase, partial [Thermoanaerobaculia bacterium]|nr:tetraacyldisaccharide 4'-kinase [Thermoanaerobaculia bacterium]
TPAVIAIVRFLQERGLRPAVLTRGYARAGTRQGVIDAADPEVWGDEPVLMKLNTNVDVIVGSNRYENAIKYLDYNDCDLFILDDGFQHLQLHRDLDVVIDVPSAAFHREGRSALRDASIVIPRRLKTIVPPEASGRPLFAFSGLADNQQFFDALRNLGLTLAGTRSFPDHHRYTADDLAAIAEAARAAGAEALLTTEKDAVKTRSWSERPLVARAEFEIDGEILERIASLVTR